MRSVWSSGVAAAPTCETLHEMTMLFINMMMILMMVTMMMICSYHGDDDDVLPANSLLSFLVNNGALG